MKPIFFFFFFFPSLVQQSSLGSKPRDIHAQDTLMVGKTPHDLFLRKLYHVAS